jgi:hypothetical protein
MGGFFRFRVVAFALAALLFGYLAICCARAATKDTDHGGHW